MPVLFVVLAEDPKRFKALVQESLCRQINAINALADVGLFFWDYGNAFLLEAKRAGADVGGSECVISRDHHDVMGTDRAVFSRNSQYSLRRYGCPELHSGSGQRGATVGCAKQWGVRSLEYILPEFVSLEW
ncbi:Urocanate hydratase [Armadillidium vulgare]|nr:Urocanate hydratase [Armadillidium vulgare]